MPLIVVYTSFSKQVIFIGYNQAMMVVIDSACVSAPSFPKFHISCNFFFYPLLNIHHILLIVMLAQKILDSLCYYNKSRKGPLLIGLFSVRNIMDVFNKSNESPMHVQYLL